jgi:hypothetical protein
MTKTLEMVFRSSANKEVTLAVAAPKEDLTLAAVKTVMQDIISKNIFSIKGAELVQFVDARITSKDSATLA